MKIGINVGLGDNIITRLLLDRIKHNYDEIRISHNKKVMENYRDNDPKYWEFLDEIGSLIFSEKPYIFDKQDYKSYAPVDYYNLISDPNTSKDSKPNLDYLCQGQSLNINKEYIVITTKVRVLPNNVLFPLMDQFYSTIKPLCTKYQIVILGEREVEISKEYAMFPQSIYGLYDNIVNNLSKDIILDLTIPSLGITTPSIKQIRQDLLIMKEAKFVVVFGIGGNFCMSSAVANTINFRRDDEFPLTQLVNKINGSHYSNVFTTQNWQQFLLEIEKYK